MSRPSSYKVDRHVTRSDTDGVPFCSNLIFMGSQTAVSLTIAIGVRRYFNRYKAGAKPAISKKGYSSRIDVQNSFKKVSNLETER